MQQIGCWTPSDIKQLHEAGRQLVVNDGPEQKLHDMEAGVAAASYSLFERHDDWSSCCYFYLDRPESGLPLLPPVGDRIAGLISGDGTTSTLA